VPEFTAILKAAAIGLICAIALAATNWLTAERIRFNETEAERALLAQLIPADSRIPSPPPILDRIPGIWQLCGDVLLARSNTPGYGGDIRLLYTIAGPLAQEAIGSGAPALIRLAILGHQETPGIADFLTDPDWLAMFEGRSADDVDAMAAITGATITSRAITEHLAAVLRKGSEMLGEPVPVACEP
jgi:Na+-translocating ferredoxin:NAD+ oxidoreductase RnfG subunit